MNKVGVSTLPVLRCCSGAIVVKAARLYTKQTNGPVGQNREPIHNPSVRQLTFNSRRDRALGGLTAGGRPQTRGDGR